MKILLFVVLKIVEISAIIFIPWGLGKIMEKIFPKLDRYEDKLMIWSIGLLVIIILMFISIFCYGNWQLVNKIIK